MAWQLIARLVIIVTGIGTRGQTACASARVVATK